jgi:surface protein
MVEQLTDENIHKAVSHWCSDRAEAETIYGHISEWNVSKVTNMKDLFHDCKGGGKKVIFDPKTLTDKELNVRPYFNEDITQWDVSQVTDMSHMFAGLKVFNQPIGIWNTKNVKNMQGMFSNANLFNQNINGWNVSKVTDMSHMFRRTANFNQSLNKWDTKNVTDMMSMFNGAKLFNGSINKWDVSKVTNMSFMFKDAISFNQPIGNWNTENVTDMMSMFNGATSFNKSLGLWDVWNVTSMIGMFSNAFNFNQDLNFWASKIGKVTNMRLMFNNAKSFLPKNIQKWNVNRNVKMGCMFYGSPIDNDKPVWFVNDINDITDCEENNKINKMWYKVEPPISYDKTPLLPRQTTNTFSSLEDNITLDSILTAYILMHGGEIPSEPLIYSIKKNNIRIFSQVGKPGICNYSPGSDDNKIRLKEKKIENLKKMREKIKIPSDNFSSYTIIRDIMHESEKKEMENRVLEMKKHNTFDKQSDAADAFFKNIEAKQNIRTYNPIVNKSFSLDGMGQNALKNTAGIYFLNDGGEINLIELKHIANIINHLKQESEKGKPNANLVVNQLLMFIDYTLRDYGRNILLVDDIINDIYSQILKQKNEGYIITTNRDDFDSRFTKHEYNHERDLLWNTIKFLYKRGYFMLTYNNSEFIIKDGMIEINIDVFKQVTKEYVIKRYFKLSDKGEKKYINKDGSNSFQIKINFTDHLKLSKIDLQCIIDIFSFLDFKIINLIDLSCRAIRGISEEEEQAKAEELYENELKETVINRRYGGKTIKKHKVKKRKNKKTKKRKNNLKNNKKTKRFKRRNKKSIKNKY